MTGGEGITIGPILLGAAKPVRTVLTATATVRRLVNMTALTAIRSRRLSDARPARATRPGVPEPASPEATDNATCGWRCRFNGACGSFRPARLR